MAIALTLALVGCVAAQDRKEESAEDLNFAQVRHVAALQYPDRRWQFDVTVEHSDEGWDHYADAWQVVNPEDMGVIVERILTHPHDNEQPFTRREIGITIPEGLTGVLVRARCTEHGFGGSAVLVDLTVAEGERFEVHAQEIDS